MALPMQAILVTPVQKQTFLFLSLDVKVCVLCGRAPHSYGGPAAAREESKFPQGSGSLSCPLQQGGTHLPLTPPMPEGVTFELTVLPSPAPEVIHPWRQSHSRSSNSSFLSFLGGGVGGGGHSSGAVLGGLRWLRGRRRAPQVTRRLFPGVAAGPARAAGRD